MQTSLVASAKARSAEPCEPTSRGKEQCGAALRGHACDDISRIRSAYLVQKTTREAIYKVSAGCCAKWPRTLIVKLRTF